MPRFHAYAFAVILAAAALSHFHAAAEREDLGNGFLHHGVATPVSNHRGTVATIDGDGNNVVLVWLFDHRGGYAILMIDAATGEAEEYPVPFPPGGDCPYASILSSGNKFYTHFNSYFSEFDPVKRAFTFFEKTVPQMAMSMTEDDSGKIWSATYPNSGVAAFDPESRTLTDYGHVYSQNWRQYQRSTAADDAGWIYFGVGNTASQIIAFDPATRTATPVVPEEHRVHGSGTVVRDVNGKVYGNAGDGKRWYELYKGQATPIEPPNVNAKTYITGSQGLFHRAFPDGKLLKTCDTVERILEVEDPATGEVKRATNSTTPAKAPTSWALPRRRAAPSTAAPPSPCAFSATTRSRTRGRTARVTASGIPWCARVTASSRAATATASCLDWDPAKPWRATKKGDAESNPLFLAEAFPDINRPHELLAHPDGKTLVLAGTPGYGLTGGGLLFWDREAKTAQVVKHTEILPEHSTYSLAPLPGGLLLGGTTTSAGTGGEQKAEVAELYIMDMATKAVTWHAASDSGREQLHGPLRRAVGPGLRRGQPAAFLCIRPENKDPGAPIRYPRHPWCHDFPPGPPGLRSGPGRRALHALPQGRGPGQPGHPRNHPARRIPRVHRPRRRLPRRAHLFRQRLAPVQLRGVFVRQLMAAYSPSAGGTASACSPAR